MKNSFLGKRLKAFRYALKGAFLLLRNEASIQVQTALAIIMTIAGFYFEITIVEWMFQIFAIGLVLSIEGLNTAVEEIADFVHPDFHNKIGLIKDIAAGAVFFAAVTAIIIGCFIYIPKF
ncbi:MAG TPA: diacylglycerol kinase family protein [Aequorivita sp.]|jgi:diacylglycerol kinase (ATP)|nr:diacylglycerol kinase [Aequorivita sp.]MBP41250.1 diacylglycerol kinase [Aequorivita sp.]HBC05256.1 diacylglycerol kinase [Aequorivita sp.]HNP66640.1 diacylglycerol kinase family protein [Aequorivita sp.]|tara:strand:+ start:33400 stop:33759 length:360 start_codon:yes stop_codon:yes gene_type:complete